MSVREPRPWKKRQKHIVTKAIILLNINKSIAIKLAIIKNEYKITILTTKYKSKIYKLILYNKITNNSIYSCHWQKTIKEKLQNLKNHQI